jgi:hypothetical protein
MIWHKKIHQQTLNCPKKDLHIDKDEEDDRVEILLCNLF